MSERAAPRWPVAVAVLGALGAIVALAQLWSPPAPSPTTTPDTTPGPDSASARPPERSEPSRPELADVPPPPAHLPWWLAVSDDHDVRLFPLSGGAPDIHALPAPAGSDAQPRLLRAGPFLVAYSNDGIWRLDPRAADLDPVRVDEPGILLPAGEGGRYWVLGSGAGRRATLLSPDGRVLFEGAAPFDPSLALAPDRLVGQGRDDYGVGTFTWSASDGALRSAGGGQPAGAVGERLLWCPPDCRRLLVHDVGRGAAVDVEVPAPRGWAFVAHSGVPAPVGDRLALAITAQADPAARGIAVVDVRSGQSETVLAPVRESDEPAQLAWTPDGAYLAIGRRDGGVLLWHAERRRLHRVAIPHTIEPWHGFALVAR